jgi:hypothetical protein
MSNTPNFEDVVIGTLGRTLSQHDLMYHYDSLHTELTSEWNVAYRVQDNFTTAVLFKTVGRDSGELRTEDMFVGVSKRNTQDRNLPIRGRSLALSRAVHAFLMDRLQSFKS